jgi:hypothetical protein
MRGMIDFHIHGGPDALSNRVYSEEDIAVEACKAGLKAIVFKSHAVPSFARTALVGKYVALWAATHGQPHPCPDIFGGVALNHSVGGLNPAMVQTSIDLKGKFVWTPSVNASHHHRVMGKGGGIDVIDSKGKVAPELLAIFDLIRDHRLILSLSHQSVHERLILIEAAREKGIERIVVNHPLGDINKATPEQIAQMAAMGAHILVTYVTSIPNMYCPQASPADMLKVFELVGFDRIVGGTELSQLGNPTPIVGLACFLRLLLALGVSESNLRKMFIDTPSRLLYA